MYDEYLRNLPGPEFIILELKDVFLRAYGYLHRTGYRDFEFTTDIARIIDLCNDTVQAPSRVYRYLEKVTHPAYRVVLGTIADGLLVTLDEFDLGDSEGYFNYRFENWVDPFTLLLRKGLVTE